MKSFTLFMTPTAELMDPVRIFLHKELENENSHFVEKHKRGTDIHDIFECRRGNVMGSLVQDASPFLFPCTIEYSLICAVICYEMWKTVTNAPAEEAATPDSSAPHPPFKGNSKILISDVECFFQAVRNRNPTISFPWTAPAHTRVYFQAFSF